ncbi:MAG: septum formation inhibitor Maf [Methylophaga sp.]|uniref:Maf family protein n=1 Tax=Methylophaga sp. UBA678 TaxID=1946901 RepID=UPI000C5FAA71|nr:nucleoside triphosphate pyrophosphatase [Methylophaga sp. UBA678]MAX50572.1 septum formation inhibitor Maf [Methylophaga sp.]
MQTLILGSSSPFRAELLKKLQINFIQHSPDIDETQLEGESAPALVERLAQEKARVIAETYPQALIIGSDQVAVADGNILGKPGNHQTAIQQLMMASGKSVTFYTGLALYNAENQTMQHIVEPFTVHFRELTEKQIEYYLNQEKPYQCAGSFKSEGFGISLFSHLEGDDPNSLIGLPLIKLIELLSNEGVDILQPNE